jgi:MFS family permease
VKRRLRRTVSSLAVRNYRLFFIGQVVSTSGIWMQQIAVAWLVLNLTNSAFALGLTTALQSVPYLLVGAWGGLVADRIPKRRLLICSQLAHVVPAALLWILTESGGIRMWMIYVLVVARGLVNVVDNPARQSFVMEMVSSERVLNAVSLNASIIQAARLVGPAAAAAVIATFGLAPCFLLNALSFLFMVVMLVLMRPGELSPARVVKRGKGQLRAGLWLVARTPELRLPLGLMAIVGLLSFNFTVVLPAVARFTFHGSATTYALMMNFLAAGALVGALVFGTRTSVTPKLVSLAALVFGAMLGLAALAGDLRLALFALIGVGAASVTFSASVQAALQLTVVPEMRGRVLSLYQIVYHGTTPLGALAVGAMAATLGARSGLVLGAVGALLAGAYGLWSSGRARSRAALGNVPRAFSTNIDLAEPPLPASVRLTPELAE